MENNRYGMFYSFKSGIILMYLGHVTSKIKLRKPHLNPAGSEDYEPQIMTGRSIVVLNKMNQSRYSFGTKYDFYHKKPPTLSKEHKIDYLMRDSPGVGKYSPQVSFKTLNDRSSKFSIPRDSRFKGCYGQLEKIPKSKI